MSETHGVETNIVCAKTRVVPIKKETIPRLELLGAVLLAKLIARVRKSLSMPNENIFAFSDSMVALAWIHGTSDKVFVRNRAEYIRKLLPAKHWLHVDGKENPADIGTRRVSTKEFVTHLAQKWKHGPSFITSNLKDCIESGRRVSAICEEEPKKAALTISEQTPRTLPFDKYSSFHKAVLVTAYLLRCLNNSRAKKHNQQLTKGPLTSAERTGALRRLIIATQKLYFGKEIQALKQKSDLPRLSQLKALNVYIDEDGLLRTSGRIQLLV